MAGGPTINDKFPNLKGETQLSSNFDLYEYLGDSWAVIMMHPGDFTPVCTTELGRAANLKEEFTKRGVKLCGFSCNDAKSHNEWIQDIEVVTGGKVDFPLFCDPQRDAATQLGILDETNKDAKGLPVTVRSVYIVKPDRTIALMMTYPASTGRNFLEIIRCIDSLQLTATKSVATGVDWTLGSEVIVNFPLTNAMADEKFGVDGWRAVEVPSESGKDVAKNYLRYTQLK
jgi:alkyl hydroperoxide reductase subunit AhpC